MSLGATRRVDLAQHRFSAPAARSSAHERDDAERARERTSVLDLHERARSLQAGVRLDAPDGADLAGHRVSASPRSDRATTATFSGIARERAVEVRAAPGHVDRVVAPRRARNSLARLRDRLVRDAARVHDGTSPPRSRTSVCPSAEQALAHGLRVRERDLAAQEPDGEGRHRPRTSSRCRLARHVLPPTALELEPCPQTLVPALPRARRRSLASREVARDVTTLPGIRGGAPSELARRRRARCWRPRRRSRERVSKDVGPRDLDRHAVQASRVAAATSTATASRSTARTGANPRRTAATATTPEPQPASRRLPRSSRDRSSMQARVVGCPPVPNARPGSTTTARCARGRIDPRRADPEAAGRDRPVELPPAVLPAVADGLGSRLRERVDDRRDAVVRDVHRELGRIAVRRSPRSLPVHARRAMRVRSRPRPLGRRRRRGGCRSAERALQAAEEAAVLVARPVRVVVERLVQLLDESALLVVEHAWAPRRRGARSASLVRTLAAPASPRRAGRAPRPAASRVARPARPLPRAT